MGALTSPPAKAGLVYSGFGLPAGDTTRRPLLRRMENEKGRGVWPAANSMREVETEIDVVVDEDEL